VNDAAHFQLRSFPSILAANQNLSIRYMRNLLLAASASIVLLMSSCTAYHRTIADSNSRVNFTAKDFSITPVYGGEATVVKVLGIDWSRFFTKRAGYIGNEASSISIPLVGAVLNPTTADQYALYDLLKRYPKYDAVFYPQFKRKKLNVLGIYTRSQSTVKARLGKLITNTGEGEEEQGNQ